MTLYKALTIELPVAAAKSSLGVGEEDALEHVAWKAYDSWVGLMSRSVEATYRNPFFGDVVARGIHQMLRTQQLGNAMSGAIFASLRAVAGLPGVSELAATRAEVHEMRAELRGLITRLEDRAGLPERLAGRRNEMAEEEFIEALDGGLHLVGDRPVRAARSAA
ncbi:MAG: hypothetical protein ABSD31_08505 [Candidatus Binataceae bacterium]